MLTLQNDRLNPSFVKDTNVVGKEMTRNDGKMRISIVTTRVGESMVVPALPTMGESVFTSLWVYAVRHLKIASEEWIGMKHVISFRLIVGRPTQATGTTELIFVRPEVNT